MSSLTPISQFSQSTIWQLAPGVAASVAGISAVWFYFQTKATTAIKQPLIQIVNAEKPLPDYASYSVVSRDYSSMRYDMKYDLCIGMKEGDWEALDSPEKSALQNFYSEYPCDAVTAKLLSEVNKKIQSIARQMGFSNPNQISVHKIDTTTSIDFLNRIDIKKELVFSLIGWGFFHQESCGVMAHEISHRILKHNEQTEMLKFILKGVRIDPTWQSMEAMSDILISHYFKKAPKTDAGKQLLQTIQKLICSH